MAKLTKATLTKKIQEQTGLSRREAQKGLNAVLHSIKSSFQKGKELRLPRIGRLVVVERKRKRLIRKNLRGRHPNSIVELHRRYPKSVRLLGGRDMSENPQPTIVHKKAEPDLVPARSRRTAIAFPVWRQRRRLR